MRETPRLWNRMPRKKWLSLRQTVTSKRKQQGPRKERSRPKSPLTAFSSLKKLARLMRQGRLPDERAGIIIRAQENAAKRAA